MNKVKRERIKGSVLDIRQNQNTRSQNVQKKTGSALENGKDRSINGQFQGLTP